LYYHLLTEIKETDKERIIKKQTEINYNEIHRFTLSQSPKIKKEILREYNKKCNKSEKQMEIEYCIINTLCIKGSISIV